MNRRELLTATAGIGVLGGVRALGAEAKPIRIRNVDIFDIEIPFAAAELQAGLRNRFTVVHIQTEGGTSGYSFGGAPKEALPNMRELLVGQDVFGIEHFLKNGLLQWGGVEEALWDTIGKIANQPVHRLLGGCNLKTVPAYVTYAWPGDKSKLKADDQVAQAIRVKDAGFKAIKFQCMRPRAADDAAASAQVKAATGPDFRVMADRTAHLSGSLWDYPTGLAAAKALQDAGVYWLEEPFSRDDFESPARLAREVDILITGGEGYNGLAAYRECLTHDTYDILQPDCRTAGGILTLCKVAAMAEAWHKPVCPHGIHSLALAGRLQASAAFGAMYQEIAVLRAPFVPEEADAPGLKVLNSKAMYVYRDGAIEIPQAPGLGLDINEEALARYRVSAAKGS